MCHHVSYVCVYCGAIVIFIFISVSVSISMWLSACLSVCLFNSKQFIHSEHINCKVIASIQLSAAGRLFTSLNMNSRDLNSWQAHPLSLSSASNVLLPPKSNWKRVGRWQIYKCNQHVMCRSSTSNLNPSQPSIGHHTRIDWWATICSSANP